MLPFQQWFINNKHIQCCQTPTCILCSFTNSSSCSATAFPSSGIRNDIGSSIECWIANTSSKCPSVSSIWMHPIYKEPEHFKFPAILAMHIQVKDAKFLKYKKPKTYIKWMCWLNKITVCMANSDPYYLTISCMFEEHTEVSYEIFMYWSLSNINFTWWLIKGIWTIIFCTKFWKFSSNALNLKIFSCYFFFFMGNWCDCLISSHELSVKHKCLCSRE